MKKELFKSILRTVSVVNAIAWTITLLLVINYKSVNVLFSIVLAIQVFFIINIILKSPNGVLNTFSNLGYSRGTLFKNIILAIFTSILITWLCIAIPLTTNLCFILQKAFLGYVTHPVIAGKGNPLFNSFDWLLPLTTIYLMITISVKQPKPVYGHTAFYVVLAFSIAFTRINMSDTLFKTGWPQWLYISFLLFFTVGMLFNLYKYFCTLEIK